MAKDEQVGVRISGKVRQAIRDEIGPSASEAAWIRDAIEMRLAGSLTAPADEETAAALAEIKAHIRQPDDEAAIRYALLVAAELLADPAGGTTVR